MRADTAFDGLRLPTFMRAPEREHTLTHERGKLILILGFLWLQNLSIRSHEGRRTKATSRKGKGGREAQPPLTADPAFGLISRFDLTPHTAKNDWMEQFYTSTLTGHQWHRRCCDAFLAGIPLHHLLAVH